jgi:hypothetical protein
MTHTERRGGDATKENPERSEGEREEIDERGDPPQDFVRHESLHHRKPQNVAK